MIKLNIEEYCENCPDFEPDVEKEVLTTEDYPYLESTFKYANTIITCKSRDRCNCFYIDMARNQKEKKEKENKK